MKYLAAFVAFATALVVLGQSNRVTRSVASLNDLKSFSDPYAQTVAVQWGHAEADGLGGVFWRDIDSATATNANNVIQSTTLNGRWLRVGLNAGGGGGVTGTGTTNTISKWTSTTAQGDSSLSDDGSTVTGTVDLNLTGDGTFSGNLTVSTLAASASDSVITENSGVFEKRTINPGAWGSYTVNRLLFADGAGDINTTNLLTWDGTEVGIDAIARLQNQNELRFGDSDDSNYAQVKAPAAISSDYTLTLPGDDGNASEFLQTDGAGVLSWAAAGAGNSFDGDDLSDTFSLHTHWNFQDVDWDFQNNSATYMVSSNSLAGFIGRSTAYTNMVAPHTISTYINLRNHDGTEQKIMGQMGSNDEWELAIDANRNVKLLIDDVTNGGTLTWTGDEALSTNDWNHIGVTWDYITTVGTNAWTDRVFSHTDTAITNAVRIYVNGTSNVVTYAKSGTFGSTVNSAGDPFIIGDSQDATQQGDFEGWMGPVDLWNRRLWVDEMEKLGRRSTVDWFTAKGTAAVQGAEIEDSNFSAGVDSWVASGPTIGGAHNSTDTGFAETLRIQSNGTTSQDVNQLFTNFEIGKLYAMHINFKVVSGTDVQFAVSDAGEFSSGSLIRSLSSTQPLGNEVFNDTTHGTWTKREWFFVPNATSQTVYLYANRTSGDAADELLVQDIDIYEVGRNFSLSPFRSSAMSSQITDISGNDYHFVLMPFTAGTTTAPEFPLIANPNKHPFTSGTFTPFLAYDNDTSGFAYDDQTGYWMLIGNVCFIQARCDLNTNGTKASGPLILEMRGLPFAPKVHAYANTPGATFAVSGFNYVTDSPMSGQIRHTDPTNYFIRFVLEDTGSSMVKANVQNSTSFNVSGFYFIR
jgi:hypothetical protein